MNKFFIFLCLFLNLNCAFAAVGDGKGNGTDYLETLFARAKTQSISLIENLTIENIDKTKLPKRHKNWLKKPHKDFTNNLEALQTYLNVLSLEFIEYGLGGCEDPELNITHGICYYDENPYIAQVIISKDRNIGLTNENSDDENLLKSMAMLIHEAGHFVGEKNHLLLDDLGAHLSKLYEDKNFIILSQYSASPYLPFVSGDILVDLNSKTIIIEDIKIDQMFVRINKESDPNSLCDLLGLGTSHFHISEKRNLKELNLYVIKNISSEIIQEDRTKYAYPYFKKISCHIDLKKSLAKP